MRILAIRGKNLASLAGEFELHFQQNPLDAAGLFAICGPTGSGKSTLLDALCLALYDETPRLTRAAGKGVSLPDVGEDTLTPRPGPSAASAAPNAAARPVHAPAAAHAAPLDPDVLARAVAAVAPTLPANHRASLATVFRALAEALEG